MLEREGNEILQLEGYTRSPAAIVALGRQEPSRSAGGQPHGLGDRREVLCHLI